MPVAYPSTLPRPLRASKSRTQVPAFTLREPRRGYAYPQATGTDTPVFWDLEWLMGKDDAAAFLRWFTDDIARGVDEFTMPIRTEFGAQTYTLQFLPDGLLDCTEPASELFRYRATVMARAFVIPAV